MSAPCPTPPAPRPMTAAEARACVRSIHEAIGGARALLLDLHQRQGWRALGYPSWRECVTREFGRRQSRLYEELAAARVELNVSGIPESGLPATQARHLARLPGDRQQAAYDRAREAAGGGPPTERHVEAAVEEERLDALAAEALAGLPAERQREVIEREQRQVRARAEARRHREEGAALGRELAACLARLEKVRRRAERRHGPAARAAVRDLARALAFLDQAQTRLRALESAGPPARAD